MAYSSGFNPHPRVSFANASPTGAATESEYLEIGLAERCDPHRVRMALDAALPPGLDVLTVVEATGGSLSERLTGSRWRMEWPVADQGVLEQAVGTFLAVDSVPVERMTKHGIRTFDARAAVVDLRVVAAGLEMVSRHLTPLVRPDDVLQGLTKLTPELAVPSGVLLVRLEHGTLGDDGIRDPLTE